MQEDVVDRLKRDHERLAGKVRALLPRVARRPMSRLALQDTLELLDTELATHEREEEGKLFPQFGAATDPLEPLLEAHARIERGRNILRNHLANWDAPPPGSLDPEALACVAEELLHTILEQFAEEERQVFNLARAHAERAAQADEAGKSAKAKGAPKAAKAAKPAKGNGPDTQAASAGA
jgi:hypothetical protein